MSRVAVNDTAPDFTLEDYTGKERSLYDIAADHHVVLVLNRGFS